jgi:hypothetical protein
MENFLKQIKKNNNYEIILGNLNNNYADINIKESDFKKLKNCLKKKLNDMQKYILINNKFGSLNYDKIKINNTIFESYYELNSKFIYNSKNFILLKNKITNKNNFSIPNIIDNITSYNVEEFYNDNNINVKFMNDNLLNINYIKIYINVNNNNLYNICSLIRFIDNLM